jgi:hypothetical protein
VVTRSGIPATDATAASSAEALPENTAQPAENTVQPAENPSATPISSSTTVTRQVYSIEYLKALGSTAIDPASFNTTLGPKVHSIGCLKGKVINNTISKPSAIEEGFEIVSKAELDDEFDVLVDEGPSAANGAVKSAIKDAIKDANADVSSLLDANDVIDGLDNAFRADWDDEE